MKNLLFILLGMFILHSCVDQEDYSEPKRHKVEVFIDSEERVLFKYDFEGNTNAVNWNTVGAIYSDWEFDRTFYIKDGLFRLMVYPQNDFPVDYKVTVDGEVVVDKTVYEDDYFEYEL